MGGEGGTRAWSVQATRLDGVGLDPGPGAKPDVAGTSTGRDLGRGKRVINATWTCDVDVSLSRMWERQRKSVMTGGSGAGVRRAGLPTMN